MNTKRVRLTTKDFWESFYTKDKSERILKKNWGGITQAHLKSIFNKYLPDGNMNYLEMGCGNSSWLIHFAKFYNYNVTGVDYSHKGIEYLKKRLKREKIKADLYEEDFFYLKNRLNKNFDIVASFGVIEHFENPYVVMEIFSSFLNKGGFLITGVPKLTGNQGNFQKFLDKEIFNKHRIITKGDLLKLYSDLGFNVYTIKEVGLFSLGLHLKKKRIIKYIYKIYNGFLNKMLKYIMPYSIINFLHFGSYYIIIGRKND